ncbi:MAG TPA: DNA-binding protein [Candidatus Binatia bacterium]
MKKLGFALTIIALTLLTATLSFAQRGPGMMWRGSGGWGPGTPYNRMYDPKVVETISGEVTSIDHITPNKGMAAGIHMNVKTDKGIVSVHLGPSWYLENQDVKIEPKDKVEVTGARTTFAGKPAIIAAEVKKGDEILKLRDESGFPVWAGWRRR